MRKDYEDIINLPRHVSKTRRPMSRIDRAAQFSPFAALTGHDAAVKETARLTDKRIELDEYMKESINQRLLTIAEWINEHIEINITYFQPDENKEGGSYINAKGTAKKIDEYKKIVVMSDNTEIPIDDIVSIEGQIFDSLSLE